MEATNPGEEGMNTVKGRWEDREAVVSGEMMRNQHFKLY